MMQMTTDCILTIEADKGGNNNIPLTGIEFKSNDGHTGTQIIQVLIQVPRF